jgi:hypothetical protein
MITMIIEKVKGFLLDPVETFRQSGNDGPGEVVAFFAALLLLNAILSAILAAVSIDALPVFDGMGWGAETPVVLFFMVLAGGFIATIIFAAWLHLWVYLFGGRRGILQTVKAVMYGSTPGLLLGWIPVLGFLFTLWSLALGILGLRELQDIGPVRSILVVALAVMIPLFLLILVAAYLITTNVVVTAVPSSPPGPV